LQEKLTVSLKTYKSVTAADVEDTHDVAAVYEFVVILLCLQSTTCITWR